MVDTVTLKRCPEGSSTSATSARMVALQARKQSIQEKLTARNDELRRLCIQEAELTGAMPPELPLEPGESPPPFRRLISTGYAYPQNLINKLKTNEVESIAALELEKQVQVGISEAALGLVHNGAASKAARRKNRLVYQQSQKRLSELDERLGFLMAARTLPNESKSSQVSHVEYSPQLSQHSSQSMPHITRQQYTSNTNPAKYKKKPRPATIDVDKDHRVHMQQYDDNHSGHYSTHSSGNSEHAATLLRPHHHERLERTASAIHPRQQVQLAPHQQYDSGLGGYWMCLDTGETVWCSMEPNYWQRETRFGSLDRSKARPLQHKWSAPSAIETEEVHKHMKTLSHQRLQPHPDMYNTLESAKYWHTNTVDSSSQPYRERAGSRKYKQKKWYETSLDPPVQDSHLTGSLESMLPPHSPYHHSPLTTPTKSPQHIPPSNPPTPPARVPSMEYVHNQGESTQFGGNNNTVPIQSPKNCTVIQPGQWKPYREVTKPFEMSDFYKYSTKFRNRNNSIGNNNEAEEKINENGGENGNGNDVTDSPTSPGYHKGIYQPLQPLKCQPFHHNISSNGMVVINENCQHSQHSPLLDMNRQQKKSYSGSSPIVPVEQTSHPQNIGYGALNSSHHSYSPGHNQNLNTSTTIKNNSMPTSTLV